MGFRAGLILITNKTIDKKSSHNPYTQDYAMIFCIVFNWFLVLQHKHKASLAYHDIKRDGNTSLFYRILNFIDLKLSSFYA